MQTLLLGDTPKSQLRSERSCFPQVRWRIDPGPFRRDPGNRKDRVKEAQKERYAKAPNE
jgi:hypothetical protein